VLEVLVARGAPVRLGDTVEARPEQWARLALRRPPTRDGWVELAKEIWRQGDLEVTSISCDLGRWWTLAAVIGPSGPPSLPAVIGDHLAEHRSDLVNRSYAGWLRDALLAPGAAPCVPTVRYQIAPESGLFAASPAAPAVGARPEVAAIPAASAAPAFGARPERAAVPAASAAPAFGARPERAASPAAPAAPEFGARPELAVTADPVGPGFRAVVEPALRRRAAW
jgi:hypothetical protein